MLNVDKLLCYPKLGQWFLTGGRPDLNFKIFVVKNDLKLVISWIHLFSPHIGQPIVDS